MQLTTMCGFPRKKIKEEFHIRTADRTFPPGWLAVMFSTKDQQQKQVLIPAENKTAERRSREIKSYNRRRIQRSTTGKVHVGFLCATSLCESEPSVANSHGHTRFTQAMHQCARVHHSYTRRHTTEQAPHTHTPAHTDTPTQTGKIDTLVWLRRPVLHRGQRHAVHTQTLSTVEVTHILL